MYVKLPPKIHGPIDQEHGLYIGTLGDSDMAPFPGGGWRGSSVRRTEPKTIEADRRRDTTIIRIS